MADLRKQALERSRGYCEKCGIKLPDNFALHHRKLRSQGGKDEISNLIVVHHKCHNTGTESIHLNPMLSYSRGWLVKSFDNPETAPLTLAGGRVVLLDIDGTYSSQVRGKNVGENTNEW